MFEEHHKVWQKMLRVLLILCILTSAIGSLSAQRVKLMLKCDSLTCQGTMSPKWYEPVKLFKISGQKGLSGTHGQLQGKRFGKAHFTIASNTLSSTDSLMIKLNNGWYPISQIKYGKQQLIFGF